jgi:hypothetical protein
MGKISKEQDRIKELNTKLVTDLLWYVNSMNDLIARFTSEAGSINAILKADLEDYKAGKVSQIS